MKKLTKQQGGFTLIEVVLVLAIGALIILMALLAFNGAQRSRRDTARTNLVGTMQAAVEQYAANNSGAYPTDTQFVGATDSLTATNSWKDPNSKGVILAGSGTFGTGVIGIKYNSGVDCSGTAGGYKIQYRQESQQLVCKDNTK